VLYCRLCGLTNSPIVSLNTLSTEADVHGAQKVLSNNGFRMTNCFCCLTNYHGVTCSLPSRITTKVLKNCKTFSSRPRPRPRPNIQDQDQDFHFCPRGASRPRPWSRDYITNRNWGSGIPHMCFICPPPTGHVVACTRLVNFAIKIKPAKVPVDHERPTSLR